MGLSLFMLFHRLGGAEMLWRRLKKMCPSISLVKKIFGTMLTNGNEVFEKAEKKKRGYTNAARGGCIREYD